MEQFESNIAFLGSRSPSEQGTPRPEIPIHISDSASEAPTMDIGLSEVASSSSLILEDYPILPSSYRGGYLNVPETQLVGEWVSWHDKADRVWASNERGVEKYQRQMGNGSRGVPLVGPPPRPPTIRYSGDGSQVVSEPYTVQAWIISCVRWFAMVWQYQRLRAEFIQSTFSQK